MREHEHSSEAIRSQLAAGPLHNYLRDWIYGDIGGAVTTFAIVSGVAGAELSPPICSCSGSPISSPMGFPWPPAII
jgi:vacuolar iron transporter family protein